jgi:hypothetical protein
MRPGLRVGSRAGPGATSSGPSAGGIGSSVLRTARRSAKAGFIEAVGVMVVVSHPARNASANQPMMSLMIKIERPAGLLSLAFLNRIWQGFAPPAPRLDGVSPYQWRHRKNFSGRTTLRGAASKRDVCSYKKRSMIGPSFLIVAAGHSFRSVMIALSRA